MSRVLGLNTSTIWTTGLEKSIEVTEKAGFEVLELRIPLVKKYLETHSLADLKSLFHGRVVSPLSLNAIEGFNSSSDQAFSEIIQQVREAALIADAIQCPYLILVPRADDTPWPQVMPQTRERLLNICEVMSSYQVKPLVEFIGFPQFPLRTFEQTTQLVGSLQTYQVGIVFDTFHHIIGTAEGDTWKQHDFSQVSVVHLDDVRQGGDRNLLTDEDRAMPGHGQGHLAELVTHLRNNGFDGPMSVELFSEEYWAWEPAEVARFAYECASRTTSS